MSDLQKQDMGAQNTDFTGKFGQASLNCLRPGEAAYISQIALNGGMRRRLQDMGVIPGVKVECVSVSPLGDPAAYLIKGAVIALRRKDSQQVHVSAGVPEAVSVYPKAACPVPVAGCENG